MKRAALGCVCLCTLFFPVAAFGDSFVASVSISAGSLRHSLQSLQRQTGIELLFDSSTVSGLRSPGVDGSFTPEEALRALLADTELTARRADSGAWIIDHPAATAVSQPDAPIPEILVTGLRSQNADIRRMENDIQPYDIVTKTELRRSHRDDLNQYFSSRVTADTTVVPSAWSQNADVLSSVDLRGLGPESTLVLIDGRRMPGIAGSFTGFRQGDLNGIPLSAVERVEVLTGTAGGIHGFGALGGVVNVVLDRNREGLDFSYTQGLSSRGDAGRRSIDASFGHTSDDGRTSFSLLGSYAESEPFLAGGRNFTIRDRNGNLAGYAATDSLYQASFGNSVGMYSLAGNDLVLKPEYGGTTLASPYSFFPINGGSTPLTIGDSLARNAGQFDWSMSESEAAHDLGATPRADSVLLNLRHRFSEKLEVYADAVMLRSRGEYHSRTGVGQVLLAPESPISPFAEDVIISFPINGFDSRQTNSFENSRYTAGLITELPSDWRGTAEASWGATRHSAVDVIQMLSSAAYGDYVGDPSDVDRNPFGDWETFEAALGTLRDEFWTQSKKRTRFRAYSLRVAGPVFEASGGPSTLSLLAERRREDVPDFIEYVSYNFVGGTPIDLEFHDPGRSTSTDSVYAELRAPVSRMLELQLAVRHDERKDAFEVTQVDTDLNIVHTKFAGTAYTAGASFTPTPWLMLRGSHATGAEPPRLDDLLESTPFDTTWGYETDSKRGGAELGEGDIRYLYGGNSGLKTQRARTTFFGVVLTPTGEDGPRISVDYSNIRRSRDVIQMATQTALDGEDLWPHRIERAPLTDEDRANGYTAGRVTFIDARLGNEGSLKVESIDSRVDWPLDFASGRLRLYADATYHLRNTRTVPLLEDEERAGWNSGPLRRRANGGFDWTRKDLTLGANLQYFGSYLVLSQGEYSGNNELNELMQGSRRIPSQKYLDLYATWRASVRDFGPLSDLTVDFGIVNVLDKSPPRESSFVVFGGPGYSRYGDPRMRRFEMTVSVHF